MAVVTFLIVFSIRYFLVWMIFVSFDILTQHLKPRGYLELTSEAKRLAFSAKRLTHAI